MKTEQGERTRRAGPWPGRLTFYHATAKGTGAALRLELRLNRGAEESYNCVFLELARQKPVDSGQERRRSPGTFAWEEKATVKMGFTDVCEVLAVLDGRKDQAGGPRGLYHQNGKTNTVIAFKKSAEREGYLLGISKKSSAGEQLFRGQIVLSDIEALGIRSVFQSTLFFMAFHPCGGLSFPAQQEVGE